MDTPTRNIAWSSPAVYFLLSTFLAGGYASAMAFAFEKLLVYPRAVAFADAPCALTRDLPRGYFFLADQLNRAALSIAARRPVSWDRARRRNSPPSTFVFLRREPILRRNPGARCQSPLAPSPATPGNCR